MARSPARPVPIGTSSRRSHSLASPQSASAASAYRSPPALLPVPVEGEPLARIGRRAWPAPRPGVRSRGPGSPRPPQHAASVRRGAAVVVPRILYASSRRPPRLRARYSVPISSPYAEHSGSGSLLLGQQLLAGSHSSRDTTCGRFIWLSVMTISPLIRIAYSSPSLDLCWHRCVEKR